MWPANTYPTRSVTRPWRWALGGVVLGLGACAAPPPAALPPALNVAATQSLPASLAAWPDAAWWRTAGDPQLAALIDEALGQSPDLAMAMARLRKASALAQVAGGAMLPTLDASGTAGLERQSINLGYPPQFQAFLPRGWNDNGQLNLTLGFDPDLWGRNRAALAAATSEAMAAQVEAQAARAALASAVAGAYADLGGALASRSLRAALLENRAGLVHLMEQRLASGLENRAAVRMAEAEAAQASGDLATADEIVARSRHLLALLLGAGPDRAQALVPAEFIALAPGLPADVTTALLGRRPDIAAARARISAAAARVRVARADFFPTLRLNALIGLQAVGLGQLLDGGATYGSLGPALSLPLFHGGARRGLYRGAAADYDAALADYNRTVLGAYQQAADAVSARAALDRRLGQARIAARAEAEALALAQGRYRAGLADRRDVLAVEARFEQARLVEAALVAAARGADVALIRALGGGFAAPAASKDHHR